MTATFIKQPGTDIIKPDAETKVQKPTVSVLVAINAGGEIWIDKKKVEPVAVSAMIERLHAENPKGGLVIQADQDATYDKVKAVLDATRSAGLTEVALSTLEN